jgi:NADH-quinone oxidoreductase subunit E
MLRRLHPDQPERFAFTPDNLAWAEAQISKYPEGRQASAIIPLLFRAQEQEGWLTKPAIEAVADMLGMARIRALEVATFYFMFQLAPVGRAAHLQICGTTPCMLCGSEALVEVCREKIALKPHQVSADGMLSWEEVECLGACSNAPMAQIGKDYYEDLTPEGLAEMIERFRAGEVPRPGPQNGRFASEPVGGATALAEEPASQEANGSVALALAIGDTVKRIDGTEVPLRAPWRAPGTADEDVEAARRDELLGPRGPDGAQGGRPTGGGEVPRDRGAASDRFGEAAGEAPDVAPIAKPPEGEVAREPEGRPAAGLGGDASAAEAGAEPGPQVTGNVDADGEPAGTKTAAEAGATPAGSTGTATPEGNSGDAEPGARPDAAQAPVPPGTDGPRGTTNSLIGSGGGHDAQTDAERTDPRDTAKGKPDGTG